MCFFEFHILFVNYLFTHRLADKLLIHPMQFVPHVIHILLHIILSIIPLFLQLVLHDHLTLWRTQNNNCNRYTQVIIVES